MKRISLSLSLILSLALSHSAGRSLPSAASPANHQNSIPKVYQRNWQLGTQKTESTTPGPKKLIFLPSRDHQKLDLDAMCLDLESSRLPNQETPGRGNVASIHQHPPTHYFPFHPSHRTTSTPSIRRTPPKRSSTPLSHPPSCPPPPQPPNLATSQKTKSSSQNRKDGELVLGSDF